MFYFAWVESTATTFGVEHHVYDEHIFNFKLQHAEGQFCSLQIEIKNPMVGLISAGRKRFAWFAWGQDYYYGAVTPLFFGELIAIPGDLQGETITLQFVARPEFYAELKQDLAETLKVAPYYDALFIDSTHWDDPDVIVETRSADWHIDRVTHAVTLSDILTGEDGVEEFFATDAFYDNFSYRIGQIGTTRVRVQATTQWNQTIPASVSNNFITVIEGGVSSWTDGIISGWPKTGQSLGGGWRVVYGFVQGPTNNGTISQSWNWQNQAQTHEDGDTMSVSGSFSHPEWGSGFGRIITESRMIQVGDPLTGTEPAGSISFQSLYTNYFSCYGILSLGIDPSAVSDLTNTETVSFDVVSDLQELAILPDASSIETISVSASNAGAATLNVSTISARGAAVVYGQIMLPSNTSAYQICVGPGTTANVEPTFSSIPGTLTVDGTATFACSGQVLGGNVGTWDSIAKGKTVLAGTIVHTNSLSSFQLATVGGAAGTTQPAFSDTYGNTATDNAVTWVSLGASGIGFIRPPAIQFTDRSSFFPTDAGLQSLEYLILLARAHLRLPARAAIVTFDCMWERAIDLSCRKNALLHDPRLPGGQALGKIIQYELNGDGSTGAFTGTIEMGCAIGLGNDITISGGTPTYVDEGYVDVGYQEYTGTVVATQSSDLAFTPPTDHGTGLVFPLSSFDVAPPVVPLTPAASTSVGSATVTEDTASSGAVSATADPLAKAQAAFEAFAKANETIISFDLPDMTGGASGQGTNVQYGISVTHLVVPKMIDLSAA